MIVLGSDRTSLVGLVAPQEISRVPTINLSPEERAALNEPVAGQGGFQTLLARLRDAVQPTGDLELTDGDVDTIRQYRTDYGGGGWQERLDRIFARTLGPFV